MGNCLRHESQDFSGFDMQEKAMNSIKEEGLLGDNNTGDFTSCSPTTTTSTTKVKIKITKKQLEELIGKVEVKELSVEQILSMLMNGSSNDRSYEAHDQLSWRPNLQSIPE
jgi:DNA-binding transcriptional regulator YhcF (GntR family)